MSINDIASTEDSGSEQAQRPRMCGLIMPISLTPTYRADHWDSVKNIIESAVVAAGFMPSMVSDGSNSNLIHGRIVQNLFDAPIVVCDVSSKNPNVMFELGLRLAFDKPTIVIKDNATDYSFDTAPIEHLPYPSDLRFDQIVAFQQLLTAKLIATDKAVEAGNYSNFLQHFRVVSLAKIDHSEVDRTDYVIGEISALRDDIGSIKLAVSAIVENQSRADVSTNSAVQKRASEAVAFRNTSESLKNSLSGQMENRLFRLALGEGKPSTLARGIALEDIARIMATKESLALNNSLMPESAKVVNTDAKNIKSNVDEDQQ